MDSQPTESCERCEFRWSCAQRKRERVGMTKETRTFFFSTSMFYFRNSMRQFITAKDPISQRDVSFRQVSSIGFSNLERLTSHESH